jgi:hypothetical protein
MRADQLEDLWKRLQPLQTDKMPLEPAGVGSGQRRAARFPRPSHGQPHRATSEATKKRVARGARAGTYSVDFVDPHHFKLAAPAIHGVEPAERYWHSQSKEQTIAAAAPRS